MDTPGSDDGIDVNAASKGRAHPIARLLPVLVLLVGLGLFFAFGLQDRLTCAALRDNRAWLADWVDAHLVWAVVAFMLAYAGIVALSVPGGAVMTVAGGILFGTVFGTVVGTVVATVMVVVAATAGATA